MKPWCHAKNSAKKYGGKPEDYMLIHDFMDSSKSAFPDMRHRALLHSSFGCFVVERAFGHNITVANNGRLQLVSVRQIAEDHIIEDIGFIPSVDKWLNNMTMQPWMLGGRRKRVKKAFIPMKEAA